MPDLTVWPTDGVDGIVSSEARWRKMARVWATSGVALASADPVTTSQLAPLLLAGPAIRVQAGAAWVDGHYAELATVQTVAATANGLLVLRFTSADNRCELLYRDAVSTPTQTVATWELPLARMAAGVMTDLRVYTNGAPTMPPDTNTTDVATTAFVLGQASVVAPGDVDDTAAAVGVSGRYARADHVHRLGPGVYDPTGVASRLNPLQIFSYFEGVGLQLGDATEYRAGAGGWLDQVAPGALYPVPWDFDGWSAIGGTVEWRWWFSMNVTTPLMGGTARVLSLKYLNVAESGVAGSLLTVSGMSGLSWSDSAGVKSFDSGWRPAPGGTGMMIPQIRSDRTGGVAGRASRTNLIISIRNV